MYWGELGQYHGRWCPCIARSSAVVYEWPVILSFDVLIVAGQNKLLKKTFELPMIWGTMTLMWRHCNVIYWCKICMFVLLKQSWNIDLFHISFQNICFGGCFYWRAFTCSFLQIYPTPLFPIKLHTITVIYFGNWGTWWAVLVRSAYLRRQMHRMQTKWSMLQLSTSLYSLLGCLKINEPQCC